MLDVHMQAAPSWQPTKNRIILFVWFSKGKTIFKGRCFLRPLPFLHLRSHHLFVDSMDQYLAANHEKPACKYMRAAIMSRYLQDYAMCIVLEQQQQQNATFGAGPQILIHQRQRRVSSSNGTARDIYISSPHSITHHQRQAHQHRISEHPITAVAKQSMPSSKLPVRMGKKPARQSGLFNKARRAKLLEELGKSSIAYLPACLHACMHTCCV